MTAEMSAWRKLAFGIVLLVAISAVAFGAVVHRKADVGGNSTKEWSTRRQGIYKVQSVYFIGNNLVNDTLEVVDGKDGTRYKINNDKSVTLTPAEDSDDVQVVLDNSTNLLSFHVEIDVTYTE